jgi:hypothetical protein
MTAIGPRQPAQALRPGTNGQIVTTVGNAAVWATPAGGGSGPTLSGVNNGKWLRTTAGAFSWEVIDRSAVTGLGTLAAKSLIAAADVDTTGILSGKVLKATGAGAASWSDDLTGATPGGVSIGNLSADVRSRLEKTSAATLDGTANGNWTTPDAAVFDVTAATSFRVWCLPDAWVTTLGQSLLSKWLAAGNQKSWRFLIAPSGFLEFTSTTAGVTSILTAGAKLVQQNAPPGVPVGLRCDVDPTGGASGHVLATFYYTTIMKPLPSDWVLLESATAASGGAMFSGSAQVMIGGDESSAGNQSFFKGKLYKAEIRGASTSTVDGALIEDFDASAVAVGDTASTGTNGHVWTAHSGVSVATTNIDMASALSLFGIFDAGTYGQKGDRKRNTNGVTTSGSNSVTGTFSGTADVGKLYRCVGGGVATTAADGAMTIGSRDANILTSAGASFTQALAGQRIVVPGAAAAGADLTARVWGVISATQLRLSKPAATSVTAKTYVISKDLYAVISAATTTTATLSTDSTGATPVNAGTTIASGAIYWYATDDAPAIQAAINACEASTNDGGSIWLHGKSMISATILGTETTNLLGHGGKGFSASLAFGSTSIMTGKANMGECFRFGVAGAGMGVTGNTTASSTTFTDANGKFTSAIVGKTIHIIGAGTNVGSCIQQSHQTTVAAFVSATQITLTAAAVTTVTNAVYSWEAGIANINGGPTISRIHVMGGEGQVCGIHIMDCNEWTLDNTTVSDFYSGVGLYSDGIGGNCQYMDIHSSQFDDCMIGVKCYKGAPNFSGVCTIDGNSNRVDTVPGPGTIGIDCYNGCNIGGVMNIQAYEIGVAVDGHGGGSNLVAPALRMEGCYQGIVLRSDGVNGGNGSIINIISWSASSIGSTSNHGLVLLAGVTNTVYNPGFYLTTDIDMYGACDATALLSCIRVGDPHLRQTYAASNVSTDRTYDASSTSTTELANVLGSLIADLRTLGVVK